MKVTPLDIKKQEFKRLMRGYDPVEVDTFMDMLANEFEELLKEQKEMRDRFVELETQLKDYRLLEKSLQQTLLQAQEATSKAYEASRREAETIVKEAESKAAQIVEEAATDLRRLTKEIEELKGRKDSLIGRLRVLLSSELDMIRTLEMGGDTTLGSAAKLEGTGKQSIEMSEILKQIDDDGTPPTH